MSESPCKILIVDDEPELVELIALRFKSKGWVTQIAYNGEQALDLLDNSRGVSVVLSDIKMPGITGQDLLARVKEENPYEPDVYLFTGSVNIDLSQLMDEGAEMVFKKPLSMRHLVKVITEHHDRKIQLGSSGQRQEIREPLETAVELIWPEINETARACTGNVARGGLFVCLEEFPKFEVGAPVEFKLNLSADQGGSIIQGRGEVAWIRHHENLAEGLRSGVGVRFLNVAQNRALSEMVNSLRTRQTIPRS